MVNNVPNFLDPEHYQRLHDQLMKGFDAPRPPDRIAELLGVLATVWATIPDMRLGQLLECALQKKLQHKPDMFMVEDDVTMEALCEFCGKTPQAPKGSTSEEGEEILS